MRSSTYLIDVDGTIFKKNGLSDWYDHEPVLMPGALEFFHKIEKESATIVLITARKESTRKILVDQLNRAGIFCDMLIMGVTNGERVMINDGPSKLMSCFVELMTLSEAIDVINTSGASVTYVNRYVIKCDVCGTEVTFTRESFETLDKSTATSFIKRKLAEVPL